MKIAAFYQCYKQRKALRFVLENFRKHYSNEACYLICDGGFDYTEEAREFNCDYHYDEKVETNQNLTFLSSFACTKFIKRFFEAISRIDADYIILLEDDVILLNPIDLNLLSSHINGCNKNEFLHQNIYRKLKSEGITPPSDQGFYYGACGGSILDVKFFKNCLKDYESIEHVVNEYCNLTPKEKWASDAILSYICYKNGGSISQYDGFCETWYPDAQLLLSTGKVKVLHQYKNLYEF